ncbi:MAG: hypothetical protein IKT98_07370 [Selenomonadaceae bacterium]|nr:hypothetical protein [Selenomonadaceae bacterium]
MDEIEKTLIEIIDTAQLDADLKTCLKKSLNAIYSHEKKIISELKSEVEAELKSGRNFLPIVTALVPREKIPAMNEKNFYAVDKDGLSDKNISVFFKTPPAFDVKKIFDESNLGSYFLCCPYEEVEELCKKTFVGRNGAKTFSYRLVPQKRLVEQELRLFRLAELYKIKTPIIFSPYARRAVDIQILDEIEPKEIDFDFSGNAELKGKIVDDYILMWNVSVKSNVESKGYVSPHDDEKFHCYIFDSGVNKKSFVLPPITSKILIEAKRINDTRIDIISSGELEDDFEVLKIFAPKIDKTFPDDIEIFSNTCDTDRVIEKNKLRTAGDVNYILSSLAQGEFSCTFETLSDAPPDNQIKSYQENFGHNYFTSRAEELFRFKTKLPYCLVKFKAPEKYRADYANFVLHFLNRNYPEFSWTGVI